MGSVSYIQDQNYDVFSDTSTNMGWNEAVWSQSLKMRPNDHVKQEGISKSGDVTVGNNINSNEWKVKQGNKTEILDPDAASATYEGVSCMETLIYG